MKELLLVCFFLNIGLSEQPTVTGLVMAILFMFLLPVKALFYYLIIDRFKFRNRTSLLTSLTLFNYSEFGLIVGGSPIKRVGSLVISWSLLPLLYLSPSWSLPQLTASVAVSIDAVHSG
ncbi:glutathione-regulated potassium-efflux system protein kefB [Vibrio sp. JCM 19236]|nr:glutathione-regulated potassium-efflux system protein kefB [Vibrio sp. JCM 19236]